MESSEGGLGQKEDDFAVLDSPSGRCPSVKIKAEIGVIQKEKSLWKKGIWLHNMAQLKDLCVFGLPFLLQNARDV